MIRLLVVDDEPDICDFVRNFFEERDFEVDVAFNGKEALAIAASRRPHIILLDIKMPVLDGMETLKQARKLFGDIKIIMVSAVDDNEKIEEARGHGVVDYITKPLLLEQLEKTVLAAADDVIS